MGVFKQMNIAHQEALWNKVLYHNEQFKNYKNAAAMYGETVQVQHVIDYHDHTAFVAECDYIDAVGPDTYYEDQGEDFMLLAKQETEASY